MSQHNQPTDAPMTTENTTKPEAPERVWMSPARARMYEADPSDRRHDPSDTVKYVRADLVATPTADAISRSEAIREAMRINCPSSYCVCSVQIVEKLRSLPSIQPAPTTAAIAEAVAAERERCAGIAKAAGEPNPCQEGCSCPYDIENSIRKGDSQ